MSSTSTVSSDRRIWPALALLLICVVLVIWRRPDAVFHAQFWAEDGRDWYAQAYNLGLRKTLSIPYSGYFHTLPRLTAAVGVRVGLRAAPLLFNLVAIAAQILPVGYLCTSRFDKLIPSYRARLALCFVYLALPNCAEIHANLTNAQWHLALVAWMALVAQPPRGRGWQVFDCGVIALAGLSGPFCIFMLPTAVVVWHYRRTRWSLTMLGVNALAALIQGASVVQSHVRAHGPPGANPTLLVRIIGGQVFLGSLLGQGGYARVFAQPWWSDGWVVPLLVAAAGLSLLLYVAVKGPWELKLFILFAATTLAAALISPQVDEHKAAWPLLAVPGIGGRYYFLPILAWIISLAWLICAQPRRGWISWGSAALLAVVLLMGIATDSRIPAFIDYDFGACVRRFDEAARGTTVSIPVNPHWMMVLHKK